VKKFVVFSIVALATLGSLAHARVPDPSNYPLRVQIMHADWHRTAWGTTGFGRGNLQQDGKVQGFDYTFDCSDPFLASDGGERYLAKWKTVGSKLSILTHPVGSPNKHSECDLKVTLHSFAFGRQNGQLVTISPQQMNQQALASAELQRELNPADTDPTHFPLKVFMLSVDWGAKTAVGYLGSGQGNVQDGDQIHAIDFNIACPAKLLPAVEGHYARGAWDGSNTRIVVLTHKTGDPSVTHECKLQATGRADVYVKQPSGSIASVTQAQYAAQAKGQAAQPTPPQ
jgi:hypothetical protein